MTMPVSGMVFVHRLRLAAINLPTKFEVPKFICYENTKVNAKCRN